MVLILLCHNFSSSDIAREYKDTPADSGYSDSEC